MLSSLFQTLLTRKRSSKEQLSTQFLSSKKTINLYKKLSSSHSTKGESKSANVREEVRTLLNDKASSPSKAKYRTSPKTLTKFDLR